MAKLELPGIHPSDLAPYSGEVFVSDWFKLEQTRISAFADATLDYQWIHLDELRAEASSFGSTIAHGFLSLSLLSYFFNEMIELPKGTTVINYGLNKVRFLAPVPAGSFIRNNLTILSAEERETASTLVNLKNVLEIKGSDKPALAAETLLLFR